MGEKSLVAKAANQSEAEGKDSLLNFSILQSATEKQNKSFKVSCQTCTFTFSELQKSWAKTFVLKERSYKMFMIFAK